MRRDSSFCAKSVRYNIFTNGAPYECSVTCTPSDEQTLQCSSTQSQSKCGCSVQRIRKNINNLTASKQATITLLDLLHLSRNKCIFFLIQPQMQECYIEPDESWLLTSLSRAGWIELCIQNYRPHAVSACMTFWNSTTIVMHTWAHKRNEKVHF